MVLSGLRDVGKTVLPNVFVGHARRNGWLVIQLEAQPGAPGKKATGRNWRGNWNAAPADSAESLPGTAGFQSMTRSWESLKT